MNLSSLVLAGAEPLPMLKGTSLVLLQAILAQAAKVMLALHYIFLDEEGPSSTSRREAIPKEGTEEKNPSTTSVFRVDHTLAAAQCSTQQEPQEQQQQQQHDTAASLVDTMPIRKKDVSAFFSLNPSATRPSASPLFSVSPSKASTNSILKSREEAMAVLQASHRIVLLTALHLLACPFCRCQEGQGGREAAPSEAPKERAEWLVEMEAVSATHDNFTSQASTYLYRFVYDKYSNAEDSSHNDAVAEVRTPTRTGRRSPRSFCAIEEQLNAATDTKPSPSVLTGQGSTSPAFQRFVKELMGGTEKSNHKDSTDVSSLSAAPSFPSVLISCVESHRFSLFVLFPFLYTTAGDEHALVWRDTTLLRRCFLQWRQRRGMGLLHRLMVVRATPTPSEAAVATPRPTFSAEENKVESSTPPIEAVEPQKEEVEEEEEGSCSSSVLIDRVLASVAKKEQEQEAHRIEGKSREEQDEEEEEEEEKGKALRAEKEKAQIGEISSLQATPIQAKYDGVHAAPAHQRDVKEHTEKSSFLRSEEHSGLSMLLRGDGDNDGDDDGDLAKKKTPTDTLHPKDSPPPSLVRTAIRYNSSTKQQSPSDNTEENTDTQKHNSSHTNAIAEMQYAHEPRKPEDTTAAMDPAGNKEVSLVHNTTQTSSEDVTSTCRSLRPTLEEVMGHPPTETHVDVKASEGHNALIQQRDEAANSRKREEEVLKVKRIIFYHWRDTRLYTRLAVAYLHKKREEALRQQAWEHWKNLYTNHTFAVKLARMKATCDAFVEEKESENFVICFTQWRWAAQARQLLRQTVGRRVWQRMRQTLQLRWYHRRNYNRERSDMMERCCGPALSCAHSPTPSASGSHAREERNENGEVLADVSQENHNAEAVEPKWVPILSLLPNRNPSLLVNVCWSRWKLKWQHQTADRWHAAQARGCVWQQWKAKAHYRHEVVVQAEAQRGTLLLRRCFATWQRQHATRCTLAPQQRASTAKRVLQTAMDRWRRRYEVRVLYTTYQANLETLQKQKKLRSCFDRWKTQWDMVNKEASFTHEKEQQTVARCFQKWKQKAQLEIIVKSDLLEFASQLYFSFLEKRCFRTWHDRKYKERVLQKQTTLEQEREREADAFLARRRTAKVFYHWRAAHFLSRHHQVDPRRRLPRALNPTTAMLLLEDEKPSSHPHNAADTHKKKVEAPNSYPPHRHHSFVSSPSSASTGIMPPPPVSITTLQTRTWVKNTRNRNDAGRGGGVLDAERTLWWSSRARQNANHSKIQTSRHVIATYVNEMMPPQRGTRKPRQQLTDRKMNEMEEKVVVVEMQEETENGDLVKQRNVFYTSPRRLEDTNNNGSHNHNHNNNNSTVSYSQITRSPYKHYETRERKQEERLTHVVETRRATRHLPSPQPRADGLNISMGSSPPPTQLLLPSPRRGPPSRPLSASRAPPVAEEPPKAPTPVATAAPLEKKKVQHRGAEHKSEGLSAVYMPTAATTSPRRSPRAATSATTTATTAAAARATAKANPPPPPSPPSHASATASQSGSAAATAHSSATMERQRARAEIKPTISSLNKVVPASRRPHQSKRSTTTTTTTTKMTTRAKTSPSSSIQVLAVTPPQQKTPIAPCSPRSNISLALTPIVRPQGGHAEGGEQSVSLSAADLYDMQS